MNRRIRTYAIAAGTILGWVAMIVDVLPWGPNLPDDMSRLALVLAGCGSVVLTLRAKSRPVDEVYYMGVEAGRRQEKVDAAVAKVNRSNVVVPFRSSKALQVPSRAP